jgi:hypothetical protein
VRCIVATATVMSRCLYSCLTTDAPLAAVSLRLGRNLKLGHAARSWAGKGMDRGIAGRDIADASGMVAAWWRHEPISIDGLRSSGGARRGGRAEEPMCHGRCLTGRWTCFGCLAKAYVVTR